ncbi:DUF995 domain-containing protein [Nitratireductor luteus]|uniref:DUF995 domain-containing protein n=1 Tax=Nitratireductor luteus TaxID=2976980 RepID=UPI002240A97F|nr:DUF995 domain-containing protein [Nitratireductor luteus]
MTKKTDADRRQGVRSTGGLCALTGALATIFIFTGQGWAASEDVLPENTRVMTGVELYMLYRGKSWQWSDGAGHMQDEGRVFKAWSGSGTDAAWAEGRWIVTDTGKLCLQADWHSQADTFGGRTCFSHRTDGQAIFQKKEPSGEWYVFRHAELQEGDEFTKLVRQDLVSAKLEALRNPTEQFDPEGTLAVQPQISEANGEVR